jgi:hypothetical protein
MGTRTQRAKILYEIGIKGSRKYLMSINLKLRPFCTVRELIWSGTFYAC